MPLLPVAILGSLAAVLAAAAPAVADSIPVRIEAAGAVLAGDVLLPREAASGRVPGVVMVHGSGRFERATYRLGAERLATMGLAVLLYDKRGVGESTGSYRDVGTENSVAALAQLADDAGRALQVLSSQPQVDPARTGLYGVSQAGWILPLAAARNGRIRFLVVLSGPAVSVGYEIRHGRLTEEGRRPIDAGLAAELAAFHGPHGYDPAETLRRLATPTLWIMGDRDGNLPLPETLRALDGLPAATSGLLTLVRFADADHGMRRPDGSHVDFWKAIESWLEARGILVRGSAPASETSAGPVPGRAQDRR